LIKTLGEMLSLAIKGHENCEIGDYELKRPSPSYSIDTIRYYKSLYGDNILLYWLIGSDSIEQLNQWHEITSLIDECNLVTMYRAGYKKPDFSKYKTLWGTERINKLEKNIIQTPLINISSSQIRQAIAEGKDVTKILHPDVAEYIAKHGLYKLKNNK